MDAWTGRRVQRRGCCTQVAGGLARSWFKWFKYWLRKQGTGEEGDREVRLLGLGFKSGLKKEFVIESADSDICLLQLSPFGTFQGNVCARLKAA